jgi:hypothetical protein
MYCVDPPRYFSYEICFAVLLTILIWIGSILSSALEDEYDKHFRIHASIVTENQHRGRLKVMAIVPIFRELAQIDL